MGDHSLQHKSLVIIGGTSGIGLSAAQAFVREKAKVVVVGLDDEHLASASKLLGVDGWVMPGDATLEGTASQAIEACVGKFGSFDGLYHVAGGSGRKLGDGPLHEITLEGWDRTFEWNLTSLMLSNRAAIRFFLEHKTPGTILNLGSVLSYAPSPRYFATHAYAAAKSAIIGFSRSLAAYYAKDQIRINVLAAALVKTSMSQRAAGDSAIQSFIRTKQPLGGGRIGYPEDLDGLAVYCMSDRSSFTTGQVIAADGGWGVSEGQY